jgi:hypothetical protein
MERLYVPPVRSTRSPELVPPTEERIECCVVVMAGQHHRRRVRMCRGGSIGRDQRGRRRARPHTSDPVPAAMLPPGLIKWDSGTRELGRSAARLVGNRMCRVEVSHSLS